MSLATLQHKRHLSSVPACSPLQKALEVQQSIETHWYHDILFKPPGQEDERWKYSLYQYHSIEETHEDFRDAAERFCEIFQPGLHCWEESNSIQSLLAILVGSLNI